MPPLRERRADIPPLVAHFVDRFNKENRRQLKVTPEAMKVLTSCYWPGNVRELENCIERTATMVKDDTIRDAAFPCKSNRCLTQTLHFLDKADAVAAVTAVSVLPRPVRAVPPEEPAPARERALAGGDDGVTRLGPTRRLPQSPAGSSATEPPEGERERLIWALEQCGWVQAKAARLLRISPRQLGYALQKCNIEVRKF
jgi:Nif-specific regulatory protein